MQLSGLGKRVLQLLEDEIGAERAKTCEIIERQDAAFPIEVRVADQRIIINQQELLEGAPIARGSVRRFFSAKS
jgi:hypothetical protein